MVSLLRRRALMVPTAQVSDILFSMGETVFNGTSDYVDTGIKLLATDIDFSITLDFTNGQKAADNTLVHCMLERGPYPGLSVSVFWSNANVYAVSFKASGQTNINVPTTEGLREKLVLTHSVGEKVNVYSTGQNMEVGGSNSTTVNLPLLIGCFVRTNGTRGRYWAGTVHNCTIYSRVLTQEEINQYLS